jgi:hypothetical protein
MTCNDLLGPATMGDPMRPLRWVSKSHDKLAAALRQMGHKVSASTIPKLLRELNYCRHYNRKTKEGGKHPDRDAQFCHITQNWRAAPLASLLIVIALISNTTTKTGLKIHCGLDRNSYPKGIKVSAEMATLNITRDAFHPEWNYSIAPRNQNMER